MVAKLKEELMLKGFTPRDISLLLPEGLQVEELAKLAFVQEVAGSQLDIVGIRADYVTPLFMIWGVEALKKAGVKLNVGNGYFLVTTREVAGFRGPFDVKASNGTQMRIWVSNGTLDEFHKNLGLTNPLSVKQGVGRSRSLTPSEYETLKEEFKGLFSPSLAVEVKVKGLNRKTRRGGTVEVSSLILKWGQLTQEGKETIATAIIRGLKVILGVSGSRITVSLGGVGEPVKLPNKVSAPVAAS